MKRNIFITFLLISALAISSFTYLKTGKMTVNNQTAFNIYVTLTGTQTYSFWAPPGKSSQTVEQGTYTFSFFADGDNVSGTINVKAATALNLKLDRAKLTVNSLIAGGIYLTLDGPRDKSFSIPPGKTVIELPPGTYKYSYYAEGTLQTGTFTLKKSGTTVKLQIIKGKLRINSNYPGNLYLTLVGPTTYYLTIGPGNSQQDLITGTYKYSYWQNGKEFSGTFTLSKSGSSLKIQGCDPSYPTVCIPPSPPDLDCGQISFTNFTVVGSDPHRFDGDNDGKGCER